MALLSTDSAPPPPLLCARQRIAALPIGTRITCGARCGCRASPMRRHIDGDRPVWMREVRGVATHKSWPESGHYPPRGPTLQVRPPRRADSPSPSTATSTLSTPCLLLVHFTSTLPSTTLNQGPRRSCRGCRRRQRRLRRRRRRRRRKQVQRHVYLPAHCGSHVFLGSYPSYGKTC